MPSLESVSAILGLLGLNLFSAVGWFFQNLGKRRAERDLAKWKRDLVERLCAQISEFSADINACAASNPRSCVLLYKHMAANLEKARAISLEHKIIAITWYSVDKAAAALERQVGQIAEGRNFEPASVMISCNSLYKEFCAASEKLRQMGE